MKVKTSVAPVGTGAGPAAVADVEPADLDAATAYRQHAPAVLGYLRARREPDAEDLLGEVFLQVSRDLHRFHGDVHELRSWIFTIARHRAIDGARRRGRRPEVLVGDAVEDGRATTTTQDPVDPVLVAALQLLTDEQREVVSLRFVADLSLEQVASITERSVGAVKALQHRALDHLRSELDGG